MAIADSSLLEHLEPIARLSAGRRKELAALCFIEKVNQDIDPMRMNMAKAAQAMYLIKGDLGLRYDDGRKVRLRGGTEVTKHPVNADPKITDTIALTDIEILRIDMDLLDIMMTWDQLSNNDNPAKTAQSSITEKSARSVGDWINETSVFSAFNLQSGIFSRLPAANVEEMFKRMTSITVTAGQVVIQQGGEGDYYYLIQRGCAQVTRIVDSSQPALMLAELNEGGAFGEDALVSDNKRNATLTMKTDGELLRLNKKDFVELLKAPIINQINLLEAQSKVSNGAVWVDVRLPSEYKYEHIDGAINLPLNEIRRLANSLNKDKEYILYCQTGRRSSAGAFVLAQSGVKAFVLTGGTRNKS
ncbi:cyclic nucleotide-binding domain-containing protein [Methylotenera versatilis]|uniref:Cyclic nucleotide-binding protein n=1 Tax=Methylotenera versatilis (strain 301) TaxID=666681 RepID=D7DN66_METV0|nr:cyclic nucleotide-binding domain-containing protein [Methylotenera versatilis]ADI29005.1 cyclic nucleotide-binding protein [Methylotenera versatilis 301]